MSSPVGFSGGCPCRSFGTFAGLNVAVVVFWRDEERTLRALLKVVSRVPLLPVVAPESLSLVVKYPVSALQALVVDVPRHGWVLGGISPPVKRPARRDF